MTLEDMRREWEDGVLRIEWQPAGSGDREPRGYMNIVMQKFFPAKQKDITKLHKAILEMYWSWWDGSTQPDPVWPRVREWIIADIEREEEMIRYYAAQYSSAMTDVAEQRNVVTEKKYADGRPVPITMQKEEKFLLEENKRIAKEYKQQYDILIRRKKKLEDNLRFIQNWKE